MAACGGDDPIDPNNGNNGGDDPGKVEPGDKTTGSVQYTLRYDLSVASSAYPLDTRAEAKTLPDSYKLAESAFTLKVEGTTPFEGKLTAHTSPAMEKGSYTATLTGGSADAEGHEAAHFTGTITHEVAAGDVKKVQEITVKLANSAVSATLGEWFKKHYTSPEFKVRTSTGGTFDVIKTTSGVAVYSTLVFVKPGAELFLSGTATESATGATVTFAEKSIGTAAAGTWHEIAIESKTTGTGGITIDFDGAFTDMDGVTVTLPATPSYGPAMKWLKKDLITEYYFSDTHTLDAANNGALDVIIDIASTSGLTGLRVEITSPLLPVELLGALGLALDMNLAEPATPAMAEALKGLGFPVGDEVLGKKHVQFDISQFMPMLYLLNAPESWTGTAVPAAFKLTASDKYGSTVRTISVSVPAQPQATPAE